MKSLIVFVSLICFAYGKRSFVDQGLHSLSNEMINQINSLGTTWKAGQNFDGVSLDSVKRLLGVPLGSGKAPKSLRRVHHRFTNDLPESFDSRQAWSNCTSLTTIRDQGNCGSCWAFSAVEAMSDRLCIHKSIQVLLSTQQIVTCNGDDGCEGGWPYDVYETYMKEGVVTGGLYQGGGCLPYTLPPCEHHIKGPLPTCPDTYLPSPKCKKECVADYGKTWEEDKYYGQEPYQIDSDQKQIMKEIMTNGPVSAVFIVYADFPNYKSGVYQRTTSQSLGGHAVKMIGWGVENGTDYWLVANSWNSYWGDKGYFKIKRGNDECGIESEIVAGLPKL